MKWEAVIYLVSRLSLAAIFLYQGLVPKILFHDPDEWFLLQQTGLPAIQVGYGVVLSGSLEIGFAALLLLRWRARWPLFFTMALMLLATGIIAGTSPQYLTRAFNPVSLNLAVASLAGVALLAHRHTPFRLTG